MTTTSPSPSRIRRAASGDGDRRVLDVPAGPGANPEIDPGVFRLTPEHEANQDAAAYDTDSLTVDALFPYERELRSQVAQACQDSLDSEIRAQQVADDLHGRAQAGRVAADTTLTQATDTAAATRARRDQLHSILTNLGPWHDPNRVGEAVWKTILTAAVIPTLAAAFEGGLNLAVLLGFNLPMSETIALAAVFSVLGVLVPHMAGVRARRFRGQHTWAARWARWGLPVVGMTLLILVQGMLAGLRTGFLDAPQIDPTTGDQQPSLLSLLGVPSWLLLAGWWAVQIAISLVVAWHAEHTHNPYVSAHRRADATDQAAQHKLTAAVAAAEQARLAAHAADENRDRVAAQFQAQRDRYQLLADQAIEIYGRAMARAKADPAFTSAMEDRLQRQAAARHQHENTGQLARLGRVS